MKEAHLIDVTKGQCEYCGYDFRGLHLKGDAYHWLVRCPKCGIFSMNWESDTLTPKTTYDYEKENNKTCPVCSRTIDYHVEGFISYEDGRVWIHRDHTVEETEK